MNIRKYCLLLAFTMTAGGFANAQNLNIENDTIRLSEKDIPLIMFPDSIQSNYLTCPKDDYDLRPDGNKIRIKSSVEKPTSPCSLIIEEGSPKRTHQFTLIFEANPVNDNFRNYSSVDKIKERIAYLDAKKKAAQAPPPAPVRVASPETGTVINTTTSTASAPVPPPAQEENIVPGDANFLMLGETKVPRANFETKVNEKLNYLAQDIRLLLVKTTPNKPKIIDNAFVLFNKDTTKRVAVSGKPPKAVRAYLTALSQLPYMEVNFTFHDIQFISKLEKQVDGTYQGYVTLLQEINAKTGDNRTYKDITQKTVQLSVKVWVEMDNGKEMTKWDVFLGNIGLTEKV